jgi:hypothetical protein
MEYGTAYIRGSKDLNDDNVSMLSMSGHPAPYQPYRPSDNNRRRSSASSSQSHTSWIASPSLQQALPPLRHSSGRMSASVFGTRATLDMPYQEPVDMENSTHFRSMSIENHLALPKLEEQATDAQNPEARTYFRHPRHFLEPWRPRFWKRFPWWGFGALFVVVLCMLMLYITLPPADQASDWRVYRHTLG